MKKILAAVTAVALIGGGGGYFYATQKFATEAGYLKDALEHGSLFKVDSVEIKPYKFQVYITGFTIDLAGVPDLINKAAGTDLPVLTIKNEHPVEMEYSPLSKKLTIFCRAKDNRIVVDYNGQKSSYIMSNYKGDYIVDLSSTPELKDKSLAQFIKDYVTGIKSSGHDVALRSEGANDAIYSANSMENGFTVVPSELGKKVTLFSDVKGEQSDVAALFDAILKYIPQDVLGVKEALSQIKPSPLLKGLKRDKNVVVSVETDFNAIIDSVMAALTLTDEAAIEAEFATLLTKLKGVKFFIDGQDQMLGAKVSTMIDATVPTSLTVGRLKGKLDVNGKSSKEFQEKLPDIIAETLRQNMPAGPEAQQDVEKMIAKVKSAFMNHGPDLVSMGTLGVKFDVDADPSRLEGNALLDIYCDLYGAKLTADSKDGNIKAILRVTNADQLFADFEAYAMKLLNDPEMDGMVSPEMKTQLPMYVAFAKTSLKSMGKESKDAKGNPVLEIEQTMPIGMLAGGAAALTAAQ